MLNRMLPVLVFVIMLGFAATATLGHAGDPVAVDDLPEQVTQSIEENFQGAEVLAAEIEFDDDDVAEYDVTFRYQGVLYEGKFREDGTLMELEQQ